MEVEKSALKPNCRFDATSRVSYLVRTYASKIFDGACTYEQLVNSTRNNKMVDETEMIHVEVIREIYVS